MDDKQADHLDTLLKSNAVPADADAGVPVFRGMAVPARAESSAELEAEEAAMIEAIQHPDLLDRNPLWPIPFYNEDGELDPPTKQDAANLKDYFGVSVAEYMLLHERKSL